MPFFSKVFKSKDDTRKKPAPITSGSAPIKKQWSDAWLRTRVDPEEVSELLHACTQDIKSRGLDVPFLLLPFRPSSDPSAARTFVRNYFWPPQDREQLTGDALANELRMSTVMVIVSVMKWCWARLPGGVVTWDTYEMFKVGEKDSRYARGAFGHFIPIGVESKARTQIIRDYFDLLAAVAAHGKTNGLSAYKLSRFAGWWAFNHIDTGKGFDAGYKSWESAADATSHLFFAYLRSLSPEGKTSGVHSLPRSLQQLLDVTQYPPGRGFISNDTTKLVMIVDTVSPTPYALLRRAKNFEYRDSDHALQEFSSFDDPIKALTDECRRVLTAISSTNQSNVSNAKTSTSLTDPSWSRFEDIGFGSGFDSDGEDGLLHPRTAPNANGAIDLARPTTPSWADFLSSGFSDDGSNRNGAPILLPPDKILPPINVAATRGQSSQSHRRNLEPTNLDPGELASITPIRVDDAFWWVWISSLAGEEPQSRKAVFGRCAVIETIFSEAQWMVMEEQVKGAAPEPAQGAYIAEKKRSFFGFTSKGGRLTRRRSGIKKSPLTEQVNGSSTDQRTTIAPDQQARIQQAAAELSRKREAEEAAARRREQPSQVPQSNRNSVFTLGPNKEEFSPALQWAKKYDKETIRAQYLGDKLAGKGSRELLTLPEQGLNHSTSSFSIQEAKELPLPPRNNRRTEWPSTPPVTTQEPPKIVEPEPAPESPMPAAAVEPVPSEAAEAPLPAASPEPTRTQHTPNKLRKSQDGGRRPVEEKRASPEGKQTTPEDKKARKLGPPPTQKTTGIRRLFGTKRSKSKDPETAKPAPEDPAIIAARAALEGRPGLAPNGTDSPPLSPSHFEKMKTVKPSKTMDEPQSAPPPPPIERKAVPEPVPAQAEYSGPPRTRRDEEYDQLSRVDTNEREDADKEFSKFDQGPLEDQPAFVPEESPTRNDFPRKAHQSAYSAVTIPVEESDDDGDEPQLTQQTSASDRWAQIRKNAAERARHSEDATTRSRGETRTDDGDTSGEETIESRVARIKARVAELTGNMEATRR